VTPASSAPARTGSPGSERATPGAGAPLGRRRRHLFAPWLAGYRKAWLRGDLTAGLLVVAIAIPLSMGMAEVAGVPPITGLATCVYPLIAYALIGASRHLVIGLDASTAAMLAATVAPLAGASADRYLALAGGLTILVGAVIMMAGSFRLGALTRLLSSPSLLGYQAGLGVIVIASQLPRLLGIGVDAADPVPRLVEVASELNNVDAWTTAVGVLVLVTVAVAQRTRPRLPAALAAIAVATAVVGLAGLDARGVAVVGDIPAGLPRFAIPALTGADLLALAASAAAIALVAGADTLATARVFATRNRYELDPNRELLALGTANVVSGFSGGITASASSARTAVAETVGGRTPLASAVAGVGLALVLAFAGGALGAVPVGALAAVVIVAVARLIDVPALARLAKEEPIDAAVALATLAAVVALGTLQGIVVAIVASTLRRLMARRRAGRERLP
jgi:MFS superfamily sulfate permease-like transporter